MTVAQGEELLVAVDDLSWEDAPGYGPGARAKILRNGGTTDSWTILLDLPPGWILPEHRHLAGEQRLILEGGYTVNGRSISAGSYAYVPKGVQHGEVSSESGCRLLIISDVEPAAEHVA